MTFIAEYLIDMFKYVIILLLFFSLIIKDAFSDIINKIIIKGNQRIESSTILSYLNINKKKRLMNRI